MKLWPCDRNRLKASSLGAASLLLYLIKAKIVTKIKACISLLKCTEEVSLLKEEGCGDEENSVCYKQQPHRSDPDSNHKSKAFQMLLFSFVDLSVSQTTKTYKTVKYKTSTFSPIILNIKEKADISTAGSSETRPQAGAYQAVGRSLNLLTFYFIFIKPVHTELIKALFPFPPDAPWQ